MTDSTAVPALPEADNKARPRIIFLSQLFDPEPTIKGLTFVKALERRCVDIEVVTGFPNYPGGKVYDGFRIRPVQRDKVSGIDVTRLAIYPSHDRSAFRRILCYTSFFLSSLVYLTFTARRAGVVLVSYPYLTAGLAAVGAKLFHRTPIILDIQDMWPDSLAATGMLGNKRLLKVVELACGFLYRHVDHIVVLSDGFRDLLIARGVPAEKISVIYNWAEETPPPPVGKFPDAFDPADRFRVLFAGNMGAAQGLSSVLTAAQEVAKHGNGITFYFMGSGLEVENLKAQCAENKIGNVRFLPRVPFSEVQQYLNAADCLLVHLRADPLFDITIPSKTQSYLYAGRPILMAVRGSAAEIVNAANAGVAVEPENPTALAEAVIQLHAAGPEALNKMGANGRKYYDAFFAFDKGITALETVLRSKMRVHEKKR